MKTKPTFVIIFCLIGFFFQSNAQYKPLLKDSSEWITFHFFEAYEAGFAIIEGDSLIDGMQYEKIVSTYYGGGLITAWLREDTLTKQVFERVSNTSEKLLYDFSLLPGDTFYRGPSVMILDSISNVVVTTGGCVSEINPVFSLANPRVFYFSTNNLSIYQTIWIEGVGSLAGLLLSNFDWGGGDLGETLLCHFDSPGERDYHYVFCDEPDDCLGSVSSTKELKSIETISISPNPTFNDLRIETQTKGAEIRRISIYNALGILESVHTVHSATYTADVSKHSKGLLYILVELTNGRKISTKAKRF